MAKLLSGTRIYGNATIDTNLIVSGNTISTSTTTGAIVVSGGVGIAGNVSVGNLNVTGNLVNTGALSIITGSNGNIALIPNGTGIVTASGAFTAVGNITGAYILGNGSQLTGIAASYANANVATFLAVFGSNTISTTGTITAGNITGAALTSNASITAITTLSSLGGLQATPIGNVTPSTALFTSVGSSGNITGAALTSNASITAITTISALGGLQATPIGNVTPSTALFTSVGSSGNITGAALTSNASITAITTIRASGGLQATPIGNVTPSTALFTSIGSSGNITGAALTSNASITAITTLSSLGGLQATPIGNVTPSTALFTSIGSSGNATVAALTVNGSATVGTTLGVTGTLTGAAAQFTTINGSGTATLNAVNVNNAGTVGTTLTVGGTATVNALVSNTTLTATSATILGNLLVEGNLRVMGNLSYINVDSFTVEDPIIQLNTGPNGAPLSIDNNFDSGVSTNYYDTADRRTFFGRKDSSGYFEYFSNVTSETGNVITGTYGTIKSGNLELVSAATVGTTVVVGGNATVAALTVNANATVGTTLGVTGNISGSGVTLTGSLTARGPGDFDGGLQSTPIGNVAPSTALFTTVGSSGNTTVSALSVNASATVGTTLGVTGNITGGNVNTAGVVRATGDVFGKEIWSTQSSGDEGGQINFAIPVTNTSLTGQVTVDVFQNRLRFFQGDNARGAYIDLTQANIGVGTNLLAGGSGGTPGGANTYVQFNDASTFGGNANFTYDKGLNIVSAGAFAGTTNGTGQNFKVGDDAWIGDINLSNTIGIKGQQDGTQGYIVFGNTNTQTLGRSGAGALTYQGGFTAQGGLQNTPIGNATPSTALFTTVGASGNATVSALTVNATATIGTTLGVTGNITGGNLSGTSIVGTLTTAAQTNITSVGTLTGLTLSGTLNGTTVQAVTIGASGNATVAALTVNGSATVGTTLGVTGNVIAGNLSTAGNVNSNFFFTGNQGAVAFKDSDGSNYVGFKAPSSVATNLIWTLPSSDGTSGQVIGTDGTGILSWITGGSGTAGYNNSTLTSFPGSAGNVFYGNGETFVGEAVTTDAFGISIIAMFSCSDPLGSLQSVDLGTVS
jgi:hypothetical protein